MLVEAAGWAAYAHEWIPARIRTEPCPNCPTKGLTRRFWPVDYAHEFCPKPRQVDLAIREDTQGGPDWIIDDRFRPNPRQIDNQGLRHIRWFFGDYYWNPEYARRGPLAYAAAVAEGLRRSVDGDTGYSGLMTKNPLHEAWGTVTLFGM